MVAEVNCEADVTPARTLARTRWRSVNGHNTVAARTLDGAFDLRLTNRPRSGVCYYCTYVPYLVKVGEQPLAGRASDGWFSECRPSHVRPANEYSVGRGTPVASTRRSRWMGPTHEPKYRSKAKSPPMLPPTTMLP